MTYFKHHGVKCDKCGLEKKCMISRRYNRNEPVEKLKPVWYLEEDKKMEKIDEFVCVDCARTLLGEERLLRYIDPIDRD